MYIHNIIAIVVHEDLYLYAYIYAKMHNACTLYIVCGVPEYFVIVHVLFAALQGLSISIADKLKQGDTKTLPTKAPCVYICMSLLSNTGGKVDGKALTFVPTVMFTTYWLRTHPVMHVCTVNLSLNPN